jgi:FlaA1/EpsC-like NDP-sugar epimerase
MPNAERELLKELHNILVKANFQKIRILPGISQIVEEDAHLIQTRSIDLQDLLGRKPVTINLKESLAYVRGKRVLVTGAGGSIGSELCRQLLSGGASRLYLLGHGENSIYQIDKELRLLQEEGVGEKATVVPIIGDLKDTDYIDYLLSQLKADAIFHAAAYKHVPMMEENPVAAIENNVLGTENLINAAIKHGVKYFVHISTDKAVAPVSVYGASKYICEQIVLNAAIKGSTNFVVVRFGNVLGSRGSIVPLLQQQIEKGGPVTITHPCVCRYFMTISEACSLVLKTGGVGENGGLYILDMGEPVKIRELAEHLIRFHGYEPETDIKIEYIGLRHGERLDESLLSQEEIPALTDYSRIIRITRKVPLSMDIEKILNDLRPICRFNSDMPHHYRNSKLLREILKQNDCVFQDNL